MSRDDRIEKLKLEYTDQYVMIDADLPQYARFKDAVGRVKTINYAGRALVQFDRDGDEGRYDIELDYLKVVDKPEPKPSPAAKKKPAPAKPKKPAPTKPDEMELSPLELARQAKDAEAKEKDAKEKDAEEKDAKEERTQEKPDAT